MKKRFVAALAAAALNIGAARAADMDVTAQPILPFGWTGFYAGANLGSVQDRETFNLDPGSGYALPPFEFVDAAGFFAGPSVIVPGTIPLPGAVTLDSGHGSFIGGLQAGYNRQFGSMVYGLEGEIDGLKVSQAFAFAGPSLRFIGNAVSVSESLNGTGTFERQFEGSFRGRIGYALDRLLLYGTGGVAVTSVKAQAAFAYNLALNPIPVSGNPAGSTSGEITKTVVGGTVGAGTEYAISKQFSFGVEYLHTFYSQDKISVGATPTLTSFAPTAPQVTPGAPVAGNYRLDSDEVILRLNWLFGR